MSRRHERPIKRTNPGGDTRWVARYTDRNGKRRSAGTFEYRGACKNPRHDGTGAAVCCAQHAIDAAYERDWAPARADTVGTYAATWTQRHPRSLRTNTSYDHRVGRTLDITVEGRAFRDWPVADVRRRQVNAILDALLRDQGRSAVGAKGVLVVLSAMWQDAIDDEVAEFNPFMGVKVKAHDPRVTKKPVRARAFTWKQMHDFARSAATVRTGKAEPCEMDAWRPVYAEPMVRCLSDLGVRLGELLPLQRRDLKAAGPCDEQGCKVTVAHLHVRRTTHEGWLTDGTKTDHGKADAGRVVPVPPELEAMLRGLPARIDARWLFPTVRGKLWRESGFYRDVWRPAQEASGLDVRPHEMRHSWVSLLRAAGVDLADLAAMAGHSVLTATTRYTHSTGRSYEAVREAVGQ